MAKCCGCECETSFCPHCGKCIAVDVPLVALLAYCRKQEKKEQTAATEGNGKPAESWHKGGDSRRKAAEKWKTWSDELAKLLAEKART